MQDRTASVPSMATFGLRRRSGECFHTLFWKRPIMGKTIPFANWLLIFGYFWTGFKPPSRKNSFWEWGGWTFFKTLPKPFLLLGPFLDHWKSGFRIEQIQRFFWLLCIPWWHLNLASKKPARVDSQIAWTTAGGVIWGPSSRLLESGWLLLPWLLDSPNPKKPLINHHSYATKTTEDTIACLGSIFFLVHRIGYLGSRDLWAPATGSRTSEKTTEMKDCRRVTLEAELSKGCVTVVAQCMLRGRRGKRVGEVWWSIRL